MTDTEKKLLGLLCEATYNLWCSTLVGNRAPVNDDLNAKLRAPQVGDLVMERSTIWYPNRDEQRFGTLLRTERRPVCTAEEWARDGGGDEPIPTEQAWVLRLLDGSVFTWTNADFIRVLDHVHGVGWAGRHLCGRRSDKHRAPVAGCCGTATKEADATDG